MPRCVIRPIGSIFVLLAISRAFLDTSTALAVGFPFGSVLYPTPSEPWALVMRDLDSDGIADVCTANPATHSISVFHGRSNGALGARVDYAVGSSPADLDLGDLNGDGYLDVVVAATDAIVVLLGDAGGRLTMAERIPTGAAAVQVRLADFDKDGRLDALARIVSGAESHLYLLMGRSGGSFGPPGPPLESTNVHGLAVVDFDRDGHMDVLTGDRSRQLVSIRRGRGDGTFVEDFALPTAVQPNVVVTGDLNEDGFLDVVAYGAQYVLVHEFSYYRHAVTVFMGRHDGFAPGIDTLPPFYWGLTPFAHFVTVADLDRDGLGDVVLNAPDGTVYLLPGEGTGAFGPARPLSIGGSVVAAAVLDVDTDGILDLVAASVRSRAVSVTRGAVGQVPGEAARTQECPTALAVVDLNRDGDNDVLVGSGGGLHVLIQYEGLPTSNIEYPLSGTPRVIVTGDLNGDQVVDVVLGGDFVQVYWGDGAGGLGAGPVLPGSADDITVADVDRDSWLDVIASSGIRILAHLNRGDGSFDPPRETVTPARIEEFAVAALDLDENLDLIVSRWGLPPGLGVMLGRGDGTFTGPTYHPTASRPGSIQVTDFDQDGVAEIAVATEQSVISVFHPLEDGRLFPVSTIGVPFWPTALAVADFNGDGLPDLAAAHEEAYVLVTPQAGGNFVRGPTRFAAARIGAIVPADVALGPATDLLLLHHSTVCGVSIVVGDDSGRLVPTVVQDLQAVYSHGVARVTWRLATESLADVVRVIVQRAESPEGPYSDASPAPQMPLEAMTFEDAPLPAGTYWYRLVLDLRGGAREFSAAVPVLVSGPSAPGTAILAIHNSSDRVAISFSVGERSGTSLNVYDVAGRLVRRLESNPLPVGTFVRDWNVRDERGIEVARGVYWVQLRVGSVRASRRVVLSRR